LDLIAPILSLESWSLDIEDESLGL
jgi:hypothetical protein